MEIGSSDLVTNSRDKAEVLNKQFKSEFMATDCRSHSGSMVIGHLLLVTYK